MTRDVDTALAEIDRIRAQLAASTRFRGFTPAIAATTGLLALALAASQAAGFDPSPTVVEMLVQWVFLAAACAFLIAGDAVVRARRLHRAMADAMIDAASRPFLPMGVAGAIAAIVILLRAPQWAAILPGCWQLLIAMGIFAALPALPRSLVWGGAWYFVAGTASLIAGAGATDISPWIMGVPFGIGQLLVAILLHMGLRRDHHD
ncbi:MAG: hypothetical protein ACTHJR_15195 [Sphingomonas sp.]|uniref:hypothetical protein n=1 Tax=Sphingomonas sp. TaxID=28214 RepID=UPI003F820FE2